MRKFRSSYLSPTTHPPYPKIPNIRMEMFIKMMYFFDLIFETIRIIKSDLIYIIIQIYLSKQNFSVSSQNLIDGTIFHRITVSHRNTVVI